MSVADWPDTFEGGDGIPRRRAFCFAINCALQSVRIPGHHAVRHESEGSGSRNQFLRPSTASRWQRLRADLPLQRVDRFATFEHLVYGAAEVRQGEIVTQIHGTQQLPERMPGSIDAIPASDRAEPL